MGPLDPEFFDDDAVRAALATRDIGRLFCLLRRVGMSQRRIAELTGQSQSEVSEILHGRQVLNVRVLERIADGFGVSRKRLGVSYGEDTPPAAKEVNEATKRRVLITAAMATALRQGTQALSAPAPLALSTDQPMPTHLGMSDVHALRAVTHRLRDVARCYGGQAGPFSATANYYTQWMRIPATDEVTAALATALAELHTEAGWCRYDSGLDGSDHFTHALWFADHAQDTYGVANAAWNAGLTLVLSGHPNDALKLFQAGRLHLGGFRPSKSTPATPDADDPRIPALKARLTRQSATAYAVMKGSDEATRLLAEAHDGWEPPDAFEHGEADLTTAYTQLNLGQLDTAEQLAASAIRTYGQGNRRDRTMAQLLLAEIHIRAGEPQGLALAHHAITEVRTLHSVAARRERLIPLATVLATQPGTDARELARAAR
ncbi:MAG: helix-turn-helix domain-containing protein, partial [Pseudonocardiaceae bacterium]